MSDDDTSDLEELKIDRQLRKSGGASIVQTHDSRFSALVGWVWAAIGGVAVSGIYYVGNKLAELNITLTRAVVQIEFHAEEIGHLKASDGEQDRRLNQVERDVAALGGEAYRGTDFKPPPGVRP